MYIKIIDQLLGLGPNYINNKELLDWVSDRNQTDDLNLRAYEVIVKLARRTIVKLHLQQKAGSVGIHEMVYQKMTLKFPPPCHNGNERKFNKVSRQYGFCGQPKSCKCSLDFMNKKNNEFWLSANSETLTMMREKFSSTMIARHGVKHPFQLERNREALRQSRKNGSDGHARLIEKIKQTNREKYGTDWAMQNESIQSSSKKTYQDRTGFSNPSNNPEVIKTRQKTLNNNFEGQGHAHPDILNKVKNTNLERYGFPNPTQNEKIKSKIFETNKLRYGRQFTQSSFSDATYDILSSPTQYKEYCNGKSCNEIAKLLNINPTTVANYHRKYGIVLANPGKSSYEDAIDSYLATHEVNYTTNSYAVIPPKQVDFYLPDHAVAIEINGLYWHSTKIRPNKLYHRQKYEACRNAGVRLLMFNSDEYDLNPEAVKSKIANVIGKSSRGVGAREINMGAVSATTANQFFNKHHLQGATGNLLCSYAAYYQDDIVAIMGFNKQRGTQAVELIRYCSDGLVYPGLFSRLFNHAIKEQHFTEIISFADLRHSDGGVYIKNGFTLVKEIPVDYRYVLGNRSYHKSSYTKKKIEKHFELDMTNNLTEKQAMDYLNIPRIYDCGKLKYMWKS